MPNNKYLKLKIDNEELDIDTGADFPITFDYQLEDTQDFQKKKSSESIGMKLPATLRNQRVLNTLHNTAVEDNTPNQTFRNIRKIVAEANGVEIFVGKALPKKATKRGGVPTSYELNCFGNNGDWMIDLKEVNLYDLIKHIKFTWDRDSIRNSWLFDGRDENMPYVFAPVKYGGFLDTKDSSNKNYSMDNMKPSLSVYWILYWGFKKAGYKIQSKFFDTVYFRRLVMPWTYGAFLTAEGTKQDTHKFLVKSKGKVNLFNSDHENYERYIDVNALSDTDAGCFDSNSDYTYDPDNREMQWKYNAPDYGKLIVGFSIILHYKFNLHGRSTAGIYVYWFKNGKQKAEQINKLLYVTDNNDKLEDRPVARYNTTVEKNDRISCKVFANIFDGPSLIDYNRSEGYLEVEEFKMEYINIPPGADITFDSYLTFKKNKFLDLLRGVADLFNLSIQTDPVNKTVLIEPTHEYSLTDNIATKNREGYFNKNILDWTQKEDLSEDSTVEIYDDNAREFVFKFKDDSSDGALKMVQDRFKIILGSGKYVFSDRFKAEKKEFENRYFSPTMHYIADEFKDVTGEAPQMICLVPENVSNTSHSEAQNTFLPKIAYYKGLVGSVGGWRYRWLNEKGEEETPISSPNFPYMFAVNYKNGGESDPILSYTDEKIGNVIGKGLIKRFFWQRLAIMNNGQWLNTQFMLNNNDITNWFHRERINLNGELWELISIKGYDSLKGKSTKCVLRKWYPISKRELDNTYPTKESIERESGIKGKKTTTDSTSGNEMDEVFDTQYNRLMALSKDIQTNTPKDTPKDK